jgi:hypothetical protein
MSAGLVGFRQSVIWQINKARRLCRHTLYNTHLWDSIQLQRKVPLRNICPAKYQLPPFGNNHAFPNRPKCG